MRTIFFSTLYEQVKSSLKSFWQENLNSVLEVPCMNCRVASSKMYKLFLERSWEMFWVCKTFSQIEETQRTLNQNRTTSQTFYFYKSVNPSPLPHSLDAAPLHIIKITLPCVMKKKQRMIKSPPNPPIRASWWIKHSLLWKGLLHIYS